MSTSPSSRPSTADKLNVTQRLHCRGLPPDSPWPQNVNTACRPTHTWIHGSRLGLLALSAWCPFSHFMTINFLFNIYATIFIFDYVNSVDDRFDSSFRLFSQPVTKDSTGVLLSLQSPSAHSVCGDTVFPVSLHRKWTILANWRSPCSSLACWSTHKRFYFCHAYIANFNAVENESKLRQVWLWTPFTKECERSRIGLLSLVNKNNMFITCALRPMQLAEAGYPAIFKLSLSTDKTMHSK